MWEQLRQAADREVLRLCRLLLLLVLTELADCDTVEEAVERIEEYAASIEPDLDAAMKRMDKKPSTRPSSVVPIRRKEGPP
jgi:hypothetical protein